MAPKLSPGQASGREALFCARNQLPARPRAGDSGALFGPSPLPATAGGAGRGGESEAGRGGAYTSAIRGLAFLLRFFTTFLPDVPDPGTCCLSLSSLCTQDSDHGTRNQSLGSFSRKAPRIQDPNSHYDGARDPAPLQEMYPGSMPGSPPWWSQEPES